MTISFEKIEILELRYLDVLYNIISQNLKEILDRFYLRIKLYNSWMKQFAESEEIKRLSDLGIGAERVFHTIFAKTTDWLPSSIPVGSNLFYECNDAFINLDIKSVYVENSWDYLGVAEVGERQTSYPMQNTWGAAEKFTPQLPCYYEINDIKKICLSYILQIIHIDIDKILENKHDPNAIAFILLAVPNGLLYKRYDEMIIEEPKTYHYKKGRRYKPANFRYAYHNCPWFIELKEKGVEEFRVRIFFNKKYFDKEFETKYKYNEMLKLKMRPEIITKLPLDIVKRNTIIFEKVNAELKLTNYNI